MILIICLGHTKIQLPPPPPLISPTITTTITVKEKEVMDFKDNMVRGIV